jgi:hypothetical protein
VLDRPRRRVRHPGSQPDGSQQDRNDQEHLWHLFAQDRAFILKAINQAVSRLYVHETTDQDAA